MRKKQQFDTVASLLFHLNLYKTDYKIIQYNKKYLIATWIKIRKKKFSFIISVEFVSKTAKQLE